MASEKVAKLVIWGQRSAVAHHRHQAHSLSWYLAHMLDDDKKDLFNTYRHGQKEKVEWLSGLTEPEIKLRIIRSAYCLLSSPQILLPSELLADAGLEYSGNTWVDVWDRPKTYETIWCTSGAHVYRPPNRRIVLDDASGFLLGQVARFRKPSSKKEPKIVVVGSSNGTRYRRPRKSKGLNLRAIFAAADEKRRALETKFTDEECFYILKPEKCDVQKGKIPSKITPSRAKKAQSQRKL